MGWILSSGFRSAPRLSLLNFSITLFLMASPAINVLAMTNLLRTLARSSDLADVVPSLSLLLVSVALFGPLNTIATTVRYRLGDALRGHLKTRLARQVTRTPLRELATETMSARISKVNDGIDINVVWQYQFLVELIQNLVAATGVVVTVWLIDWLAGLLTATALLPVLVAALYVSRFSERSWDNVAPLYTREGYAREQIIRQRSAMELASLGTAGRIADMIAGTWSAITAELRRQLRPQILGGVLSGLATAGILAGAMVAVIVGTRFGTGAAAGVIGVMSALTAVAGAGNVIGAVIESAPMSTSVRRFLERDLPARDHDVQPAADALEIAGATYAYAGSDGKAIDAVSISARRGEMIALVGRNGAGKTTLINSLIGLYDLGEGRISVDGRDLAALPEAERLGYFGVLTQEFSRYEFTVRDAVRLGAPSGRTVTDDEIWHALESARAADFVRTMPGRLDQQLGQQFGGVGLSGGQWQRLALARIYLRGAPIWVLDEPTSSIDGESEALIFQELARSRHDRITLVVSHRAWTLKDMDRIHVIDEGRLVESGTFSELLGAGGTFSELFGEQLVAEVEVSDG